MIIIRVFVTGSGDTGSGNNILSIFSYKSFKSILPKLKHILYSLRLDEVSLGQTNIYCIGKPNFLKMSLKMDGRECRLAVEGQSQVLELP